MQRNFSAPGLVGFAPSIAASQLRNLPCVGMTIKLAMRSSINVPRIFNITITACHRTHGAKGISRWSESHGDAKSQPQNRYRAPSVSSASAFSPYCTWHRISLQLKSVSPNSTNWMC
ncbi:hypothetical protein CI102_958 [Trichoderma harzianum]|nr:hypothetical protein CI102_958 [Trichoderma harzianum]